MSESYEEQQDRVKLMAEGDSQWDLSPNDIASLRAVLANLEAVRHELQSMRTPMLCGHWSCFQRSKIPITVPGPATECVWCLSEASEKEIANSHNDVRETQARLEAALAENDALKASNKVIQEHYSALFAERDQLKQELEDSFKGDPFQEPFSKLMAERHKAQAERDAALKAVKVLQDGLKHCAGAGERQNALLRRLKYVFHRFPRDMKKQPPVGDSERWEYLAFHMHTDIWEGAQQAENVLEEAADPAPDLVLVPKEQVRLAHELAEFAETVSRPQQNIASNSDNGLLARARAYLEKENR